MRIALTRIRSRRTPTLLGWLLIATLLALLLLGLLKGIYPFLAPQKPINKGFMVVEGWIHDAALDEAITMFNSGDYSQMVCTGVQIETGSYIQQFRSYPEMTAARLIKMGVDPEKIMVTVANDAKKDRTYQAAMALRLALLSSDTEETDLHLITTGPHGRRSRMLFKKALGSDYTIGITCLAPASYEPEEWYKCSEGVRYVMSEALAYMYAKLFFHP